jgi:hypothetical protein
MTHVLNTRPQMESPVNIELVVFFHRDDMLFLGLARRERQEHCQLMQNRSI